MIRKAVVMLVLLLSLQGTVAAAPKKASSAKRTARVLFFPVVHPMQTVKGVLYGALNTVGTVVDGVEYVTGEIAAGVSKVDDLIDGAETKTVPVQKAAPSGKQPANGSASSPD